MGSYPLGGNPVGPWLDAMGLAMYRPVFKLAKVTSATAAFVLSDDLNIGADIDNERCLFQKGARLDAHRRGGPRAPQENDRGHGQVSQPTFWCFLKSKMSSQPVYRYAGQDSKDDEEDAMQKSELNKQEIAVAKKTRTAKEMKV